MDKFFYNRVCDRCGVELGAFTMSMMNTDCLCMDCADKEKQHPRYQEAAKAELEAVRRGDYNYLGLFAGQKYPFGGSNG